MTTDDNTIHQDTEQWLAEYAQHGESRTLATLKKLTDFISDNTANTPIPHFTSALSAGCHLAKECQRFEAEDITIAAALLFPTLQHHQLSNELLSTHVNKDILILATGVIKTNVIDSLQNIHDKKFLSSQSDKLRRMLLSIVDDVRVIFIRLVHCVTVLRAIKEETEQVKVSYAEKIMQLYAPLANRLGLGQIKWELEDIAFRYLDPESYFNISKSLKLRRTEREAFIQSMQSMLSQLLKEACIKNPDISGRVKHIYSIHKKITRKKVDFTAIFDTSALRILVPSLEDCYETLSIIHTTWEHIPDEFDDYIANPKPNGYRSIHTAVNVPDKGCVEIQIRTTQMHQEAELGVAAHWKYKEGTNQSTSYAEKIDLLRQMLDWQKSVSQEEKDEAHQDLFGDRIYIFSPQEQVYDLAKDATALDFAYRVHTQVGHRCKGAKINGKLEPLTQQLKTGDTVEIMTGKEDNPSRDWLNLNLGYLNTSQAITKVRLFFRKQLYEEHLLQGQSLWEKACRRHEIKKNQLDKIYKRFNFKSKNDLLASLGGGDIGITTIVHYIRSLNTVTEEKTTTTASMTFNQTASTNRPSSSQFSIEGVDNLLTQIALCCKPIPGDNITGYVTKDRGITIHKATCPNLQQSKKKSPERVINVAWQHANEQHFIVELGIEANDRKGILNDITEELKRSPIVLVGMQSFVDQVKNLAYINLTLNTQEKKDLKNLMSSINRINDVIKVTRK